jgi:hypothetical protein
MLRIPNKNFFRAWNGAKWASPQEFSLVDLIGFNHRYRFLQYTGSTDSAQNPIYEGDIVLWHTEDPFDGGYFHKKMVVGWNQRCMQFRLFEFPNQVGKAAGETFWAEDVRVIGHIFDYENEECRYHLDESAKSLAKQSDTKP